MAKNKMSQKAKIFGLIGLIAGVGALIILGFILIPPLINNQNNQTNNSNNTNNSVMYTDIKTAINNLPAPDALDYILAELSGYWVSGNQFVGFSADSVDYGLKQSGFWIIGNITGSEIIKDDSFAIKIFIPAREASEIDGPQDARSEKIYVDVSTFSQDGRISIKISNLGNGQWQTYEHGGKTLEDLY